jgi:hypothetical protein
LKKIKKGLDGVFQSVKIWLKFSKYQKNVGLMALIRGDEGRDGGGDGAGLSESSKKIQKPGGQRPGCQASCGLWIRYG